VHVLIDSLYKVWYTASADFDSLNVFLQHKAVGLCQFCNAIHLHEKNRAYSNKEKITSSKGAIATRDVD